MFPSGTVVFNKELITGQYHSNRLFEWRTRTSSFGYSHKMDTTESFIALFSPEGPVSTVIFIERG